MTTIDNAVTPAGSIGRGLMWLIFAYTFLFGIYMGGGLFETIVITPMWSASAEAARQYNEGPFGVVNNGRFFFVIAPLSLLLSIATLVGGWKAPQPLRFWLRLSIGVFLLTFLLTGLYYVPEQGAIKGAATAGLADAEIMARANRWVVLNWLRFAVAFAIWSMTLHALGLAYRLYPPRPAA